MRRPVRWVVPKTATLSWACSGSSIPGKPATRTDGTWLWYSNSGF